MKEKRKLIIIWLCFVVLFGGLNTGAVHVSADAKSESKVEYLNPISLGTIKLQDNVNAKLLNLIATPDNNSQFIAITLQVTNKSRSEVQFLDYWLEAYTKAGAKVNLKMIDSQINKIPADSTVNIVFTGTVGIGVKLSDITLKLIKWDFSVSSYKRVLGQIEVPDRYSPVTPAGKGRSVVTGDAQISFYIKNAIIGKSDSYYRPEITLSIRNNGVRSITLPDYQLYVMTEGNLMYPLTTKDMKGVALDPWTEKEFKLTAQIPIKVKASNWKLVVVSLENEGKDKQSLALFELPKAEVTSGNTLGKYYSFLTAEGMYEMKLDTIYRLPIEDDDLIVSSFTVANKTNKTLQMPDLKAEYTFNGSVNRTANVLENNKLIALQPNQTTVVQFSARVPYTFSIGETKISIKSNDSTEKPDSSNSIDLVAFEYKDAFNSIPRLTAKSTMKINDVGYRSEISLKDYQLFEGVNTDIVMVQLTTQNMEKRQAAHPKLVGYFEKEDGTVFEAVVDTLDEKIGANGKGLLQAVATLPKGTTTEDMRFVLGKAILESAQTGGSDGKTTEKLAGYASPVSFQMPSVRELKNDLQHIDLTPFDFTINRVATQIKYNATQGESKVTLDFDYTLSRDLLTKANVKDRKIVLELVDVKQGTKFTKELTLPSGDTKAQSEDITLQLGDRTQRIEWDNQDVFLIIQELKEFQFNVYAQAQTGYRSLIATQNFNWLSNKSLK
ncbi:hypothetical protein [Cohnella phaseoli]|uniref:Uncharacterized protein n=1 Tax=Cohnella phaseoli TaxID=456490 RepID=A0A3D9KBY8_9BACL|nr:hypothetical protein [Cohnella phaseoli]RED84044.1 hypothetical protein DFP98_107152 [Cohnella phaseoli]